MDAAKTSVDLHGLCCPLVDHPEQRARGTCCGFAQGALLGELKRKTGQSRSTHHYTQRFRSRTLCRTRHTRATLAERRPASRLVNLSQCPGIECHRGAFSSGETQFDRDAVVLGNQVDGAGNSARCEARVPSGAGSIRERPARTRILDPLIAARSRHQPCLRWGLLAIALAACGVSPQGFAGASHLLFTVGGQDGNSARPATLQIFFTPSAESVRLLRFEVPFPADRYQSVRTPGCFSSRRCHFDEESRVLVVAAEAEPEQSLSTELLCEVDVRFQAGVASGIYPLSIEGLQVQATGSGGPVLTWSGNSIQALDASQGSTALVFSPGPDLDCDGTTAALRADAEGRVTVSLEALEPSAREPLALSCGVSGGLIARSGVEQSFPAQPLQPIEIQCAAGDPGAVQELICLEGSSGGERGFRWAIHCARAVFNNGFESP